MSVSTYDIDRTFADQASELQALDRAVSELRYNLEEVSQGQDVLKRQISILETDSIEPLSSSVADLEQATEEMQRDLAQTRTVVQHLAGRLAWLEHHVRTGSGLVAVAIDEADPALQDLARRADLASTARAGILSESQRSYQQARIIRHDNLGQQRQQYLAEAVAQSKVLANCPKSGEEHAAASTAFRAAVSQADKLADQISSARDRASNARARLAADDESAVPMRPPLPQANRPRSCFTEGSASASPTPSATESSSLPGSPPPSATARQPREPPNGSPPPLNSSPTASPTASPTPPSHSAPARLRPGDKSRLVQHPHHHTPQTTPMALIGRPP